MLLLAPPSAALIGVVTYERSSVFTLRAIPASKPACKPQSDFAIPVICRISLPLQPSGIPTLDVVKRRAKDHTNIRSKGPPPVKELYFGGIISHSIQSGPAPPPSFLSFRAARPHLGSNAPASLFAFAAVDRLPCLVPAKTAATNLPSFFRS